MQITGNMRQANFEGSTTTAYAERNRNLGGRLVESVIRREKGVDRKRLHELSDDSIALFNACTIEVLEECYDERYELQHAEIARIARSNPDILQYVPAGDLTDADFNPSQPTNFIDEENQAIERELSSNDVFPYVERALSRVYASKLLALQNRREKDRNNDQFLTQHQRGFLAHHHLKYGIDSVVTEKTYFNRLGFSSLGDMLLKLKVDLDGEELRQLIHDDRSGSKIVLPSDARQSAKEAQHIEQGTNGWWSVPENRRKTIEGVMSVGGLVAASVIAGPLGAVGALGGMAGRQAGKFFGKKFGERELYKKDDKGIAVHTTLGIDLIKQYMDAEAAIKAANNTQITERVAGASPYTTVATERYKGEKGPETLTAIMDVLSRNADAQVKSKDSSLSKYLEIEKKGKRGSALGGLVGGIFGGTLATTAYHALHNLDLLHLYQNLQNGGASVDFDADGVKHFIQNVHDPVGGHEGVYWFHNQQDIYRGGLESVHVFEPMAKDAALHSAHNIPHGIGANGGLLIDWARFYAHADLKPMDVDMLVRDGLVHAFITGLMTSTAFVATAAVLDKLNFFAGGKQASNYQRSAKAIVAALNNQLAQRSNEESNLADEGRDKVVDAQFDAAFTKEVVPGTYWRYTEKGVFGWTMVHDYCVKRNEDGKVHVVEVAGYGALEDGHPITEGRERVLERDVLLKARQDNCLQLLAPTTEEMEVHLEEQKATVQEHQEHPQREAFSDFVGNSWYDDVYGSAPQDTYLVVVNNSNDSKKLEEFFKSMNKQHALTAPRQMLMRIVLRNQRHTGPIEVMDINQGVGSVFVRLARKYNINLLRTYEEASVDDSPPITRTINPIATIDSDDETIEALKAAAILDHSNHPPIVVEV